MSLRQASRAMTQMFDEALRPAGVRATQLGLLLTTRAGGHLTITRLAELLIMDRTTLTRNLKPLEKQGLVRVVCGEDRRVRTVALTGKGQEACDRALPLWHAVQTRVVGRLGEARFERLLADLNAAVEAARVADGPA